MPSGHHTIDYEHAGHCVEYIRHVGHPKLAQQLHGLTSSKAIMCAGDLTLEAPENPSRTHLESIAYDETIHLCRDWTALSDALRRTSLGFELDEGRGLVPYDHSDWQPRRPVVPFEAV